MDHLTMEGGHLKFIMSGRHVGELEFAAGVDVRSTVHIAVPGEHNDQAGLECGAGLYFSAYGNAFMFMRSELTLGVRCEIE
jgi:hypothetical protein